MQTREAKSGERWRARPPPGNAHMHTRYRSLADFSPPTPPDNKLPGVCKLLELNFSANCDTEINSTELASNLDTKITATENFSSLRRKRLVVNLRVLGGASGFAQFKSLLGAFELSE